MSTFSTELQESRDRKRENEKSVSREIGLRKCSKCGTQMLLGYLRPMQANKLDDFETEVLWDRGDSLGVFQTLDVWACPKCGNAEFQVIFPQKIKVEEVLNSSTQKDKQKNNVNSITQPMIYDLGDKLVKSYCPDCYQPIEEGASKCSVCGKIFIKK